MVNHLILKPKVATESYPTISCTNILYNFQKFCLNLELLQKEMNVTAFVLRVDEDKKQKSIRVVNC